MNHKAPNNRWLPLPASVLTPLIALVAVAAWWVPSAIEAQPAIEAWVERYDGPTGSDDSAGDLAVDANGDLYVTGVTYGGDPAYGGTGSDWVTIKYSSAGSALWTNYYNGPENSDDAARAIALDSAGNVVVTGSSTSWSPQYLSRVVTIAYSSAGEPLWTNRFNPPGYAYSWPVAMEPDTSGNVVIMGGATQTGGESYCLVIKYSRSGALLLVRTYSYGNGWASALALDSSGNVIVTGCSRGGAGFEDYLTLKYSSAGALMWAKLYNGPLASGQDRANALAVDADGGVIVTGSSDSVRANYWEYATIKYSGAGVPLWTNRYNGPANYSSTAQALATDKDSNVVVTGWSAGIGAKNFVTIKYSSTGVPLWTNVYTEPVNGLDEPRAITVDSIGNAYITGGAYEPPLYGASVWDAVTFAYSSSGVPLWTNRYDGPGDSSEAFGGVAVDAGGNVYVAGRSAVITGPSSPSIGDWVTIKYVTPLRITRQPLSRTNVVGTVASFTVEAVGGIPLSYQWRLWGTNLLDVGRVSGAMTPTLLIANVEPADVGEYSVVVANSSNSVTSAAARLTVDVPPNPGRFSHIAYSPQTGVSFIFRDATVGKPYRIQTSASAEVGSWVDWMTFTFTEPVAFTDLGALTKTNRFYRAVTP